MRAELVIIGSVFLQHATQLRFVEHDEVIEAFASKRADEMLDITVLPRRPCRNRVVADPNGANALGVGWAECAVTVTQQVARRFVPRKGVGYLTGEPRGGRIGRHTNRD